MTPTEVAEIEASATGATNAAGKFNPNSPKTLSASSGLT